MLINLGSELRGLGKQAAKASWELSDGQGSALNDLLVFLSEGPLVSLLALAVTA